MIKSKEMLDLISNTLDINKAQDIKIIDLNGKAYFADYMVIATATSSRQCSALARYVEDELRKKGYKEAIISGKHLVIGLRWIVVMLLFIYSAQKFVNFMT